MSLFEKVQKLSSDCHKELMDYYESGEIKFPIELRNLLAQPIENAVCGSSVESLGSGLDPDNPSHTIQICEFLEALLQSLESKLNGGEELPFFIKHKLAEALRTLKERQGADPLSVYRRIRECIGFEIELVQRQELTLGGSGGITEPDIIMDNLTFVRKRVELTADILNRMVAEQEAFEINLAEKNNHEEQLSTARDANERLQITQLISQKSAQVDQNLQQMLLLKTEFLEGSKANISYISNIQTSIFQEKLFIWKYQQQQEANGMQMHTSITLDRLQIYCEQLADLIWKTRQQLSDTEQLQSRNAVFATIDPNETTPATLKEEVLRLLTTLLNEAFVVEDQPPQVLKKTTKFPTAVKVSLLLGNLNIQMSAPQVSSCIIREAQARTLSIADQIDKGGEIVNATAKFEFDSKVRRLVAKFPNIQLKDIKRADRRGSNNNFECVMEEKFCLLFECFVIVCDLKLRIRTMSLPVVVTSHGSQEPTATAAIMWDNAFGQMGRVPFQVPARVAWNDLAHVISARFQIVTGRGLNAEQLQYLRQKAFRSGSHSENINWTEFCKDNLTDRAFSFWDWVFAAMKTIEKKDTHLKEIWKEGLLMGFIDRLAAENMLMCQEPGTFLLRFSDSIPGAVTIVMVNDARTVISINPYTPKDLETNRLADNIKKLAKLKFLFPRIPKDDAFGKYYSPEGQKGHYVEVVPDIPSGEEISRSRSGSVDSQSVPTIPSPSIVLYPSPPIPINTQAQQPQMNPFDTTFDTSMDIGTEDLNEIIRQLSNPSSPAHCPSPSNYNIPDLPQLTPTTCQTFNLDNFTNLNQTNNVQMVDQFLPQEEFMNQHTDLLTIGSMNSTSNTNGTPTGHWTGHVTI